MRSRVRILVLIPLLLFATTALVQEAPPTPLAGGSATLDEIKGDVTVKLPGAADPTKAAAGQQLPPETLIEVGKGSALLHLEDGSQVLIKGKTRVQLKSAHEGAARYFELLIGKILAKVQKRLGNSPSFRLGTPSAVITVRGTRFEVSVNDKGKTYVEVYEGLVQVDAMGGIGPSVLVRPGFHTNVQRDRAPEPPISFNRELNDDRRGMAGGRESGDWGQEGSRAGEREGTGTGSEQEDPH